MNDFKALSTAINIFVSPGEAFRALKEHSRAWFPIVVLIVVNGALSLLYLNLVDNDWLAETQIRAGAGENMSEAQIQQLVSVQAGIPPIVRGAISFVVLAIVIPLLMFLPALYLKIVSALTNDGIKLKQWFSLVAWCSLVGLVASVASLANLAMNDVTFMSQTEINPISFVNLFGLEEPGPGAGAQVVANLNFTSIWSLLLMVFGYQVFTKRSLFASAAIVLAPYALIAAIAMYFSMG